MFYQIILIIIFVFIILYFTNSFSYFEGFSSKILNLNINNSQSGGGNDVNYVTPYYGAWGGWGNWGNNYGPYYSRYPYYYNNYRSPYFY
jgi:hypothetical protein